MLIKWCERTVVEESVLNSEIRHWLLLDQYSQYFGFICGPGGLLKIVAAPTFLELGKRCNDFLDGVQYYASTVSKLVMENNNSVTVSPIGDLPNKDDRSKFLRQVFDLAADGLDQEIKDFLDVWLSNIKETAIRQDQLGISRLVLA